MSNTRVYFITFVFSILSDNKSCSSYGTVLTWWTEHHKTFETLPNQIGGLERAQLNFKVWEILFPSPQFVVHLFYKKDRFSDKNQFLKFKLWFFHLTTEFFPVSKLCIWWCASKLGAALLCSDLGLIFWSPKNICYMYISPITIYLILNFIEKLLLRLINFVFG